MAHRFRLYWLRETGRDLGTPLQAAALEPEIRNRVIALAGAGEEQIDVRLPFLDRREWRRRGAILNALTLERHGDTIECALSPAEAARDCAATLALSDPAWLGAPDERTLAYFPAWQRVSLTLQAHLRACVAHEYFRDVTAFHNREAAYPMLVYSAARLCFGRPRHDFTYDLRDFPSDLTTLAESWKMTGRALQSALATAEARLHAAGLPVLARRYGPVWHEDVLAAVRKKPKPFVALLSAESAVINALIDLGTERNAASINRFARTCSRALRNVHGMDLTALAVPALEEATRVLVSQLAAGGRNDLSSGRTLENGDALASRGPDAGVGDEEDRDHRYAHGGGKMTDAGIVADVQTCAGEPAGQIV